MRATRSRAGRAACALGALLLLASCGEASTPPGVAATLDGTRIDEAEVDDFAEVLCQIQLDSGTGAPQPMKAIRAQALDFLLQIEVAGQLSDLDAVPPATIRAAQQESRSVRDALPEDLRGTFDEVVRDFAAAQGALVAAGRASLEEQGQGGRITDEEAFAEGQRLRAERLESADLTIDPRFGSLAEGVVTPGGGSLSVPVSDVAVQAAGGQEEAQGAAPSGLPAALLCQ